MDRAMPWCPEAFTIECCVGWLLPESSESVGEARSLPLARSALASRCGEAALAPPLGELLSEREAEGVHYDGCHSLVYEQTPPPHVRSAPPLSGEARALRASGSPSWRPLQWLCKTMGTHHSNLRHSLREGAKGASHQGTAGGISAASTGGGGSQGG